MTIHPAARADHRRRRSGLMSRSSGQRHITRLAAKETSRSKKTAKYVPMDDWAADYVDGPDAAASIVHTRGGAFDYNFLQKCSDRFPHPVFQTNSDVGFRCCADVIP